MALYQHSNFELARASLAIALLGLATATACAPVVYDDRCGPQLRGEQSEAPLRDAATNDLGKAIVTVSETRGGTYPRSLTLTLMGPGYGSHGGPLKGQVNAVLLADATGAVRLDVPVNPPPLNGDEIISTAIIPIDDITTFSTLERAMVDGKLRLHIETSRGAPPVADVSFPFAPLGTWGQAHCS